MRLDVRSLENRWVRLEPFTPALENEARAADGIWYRASGYELRGRGAMASWSAQGRRPTDCRAVD